MVERSPVLRPDAGRYPASRAWHTLPQRVTASRTRDCRPEAVATNGLERRTQAFPSHHQSVRRPRRVSRFSARRFQNGRGSRLLLELVTTTQSCVFLSFPQQNGRPEIVDRRTPPVEKAVQSRLRSSVPGQLLRNTHAGSRE